MRRDQMRYSGSMLRDAKDIWSLSLANRHALADLWLKELNAVAQKKIRAGRERHKEACRRHRIIDEERDASILRGAKVIGMTTTGAAKNRKLLERVRPIVLIVEEAAEVLEAHILSALVPSIQHMILIGDHQQLRPKTEIYNLARRHELDVSMFERLIDIGVPYTILNTQHRMRPEFSRLLTPSIYETLIDHPSVELYPRIKGMSKDLQFVCHTNPENTNNQSDSKSKTNEHEGNNKFLLI